MELAWWLGELDAMEAAGFASLWHRSERGLVGGRAAAVSTWRTSQQRWTVAGLGYSTWPTVSRRRVPLCLLLTHLPDECVLWPFAATGLIDCLCYCHLLPTRSYGST